MALLKFRTTAGGFELLGRLPPQEILSAYVLLLLNEMERVVDYVDENVMKDIENWLLSRRDGNG